MIVDLSPCTICGFPAPIGRSICADCVREQQDEQPTCGSVFSGGGLADVGLKAAGFRPVFAVEHDPQIADVYRHNLGDHVIVGDAQSVDPSTLPEVDLLWASPPCQAFSVARSKTLTARNDADVGLCLTAYITHCDPRVFILENVEGYANSPTFHAIVAHLFSRGYWVHFAVLNSADVGVPQTRRRLILRAVKDQLVPPVPQPVRRVGWYEAIEDLVPTLPPSRFAAWQLARLPDALGTFLIGSGNTQKTNVDSKARPADAPMFTVSASDAGLRSRAFLVEGTAAPDNRPIQARTAGEPIWTLRSAGRTDQRAFLVDGQASDNQTRLTVRQDDAPVHTLTASMDRRPFRALLVGQDSKMTTRDGDEPSMTTLASDKSNYIRAWLDQGRVVKMTPRALARFQTVPDWYELPPSNALACKAIGNGVPCLLAQRLGEQFL